MKADSKVLNGQNILFLFVTGGEGSVWFFVNKVGKRLSFYQRQFCTRRHLRNLSEDQLIDIGVTAEQAATEANKFFWEN